MKLLFFLNLMGTINCCEIKKKLGDEKFFGEEAKSNFKHTNDNLPIYPSDKSYFNTLNNSKILNQIKTIQNNYRASNSRMLMKETFNKERTIILNTLLQKLLKDTSIIKNLECEKFYESLLKSNKIIPFTNLDFFPKINKSYLNFSFPIEEYIQYSPNQIYIGSYNIKGNFNGYGILYEIDNQENTNKKIEGFFLDGILNNESRIFTSNNEFYSGKFINNKLNGEGHFIKNEIEYIGNFLNNLQNGKGKEIYNDNSTFEGLFLNGNKIKGKFIWNDGNSYDGEIQNDLFNGFGIYEWGKNKKYEGNWKNGKMNGKGKILYSDGSFYEGDFIDNLRCGYGKYVWNKNKYYDGQWNNDKQNGKGIYNKNGYIVKGFWIDGKIISGHNNRKNNKRTEINKFHNIKEENEHSITNRTINSINGIILNNNNTNENINTNENNNNINENNNNINENKNNTNDNNDNNTDIIDNNNNENKKNNDNSNDNK